MSSILKGIINESQNSVFLTETITYKLWESAGKKIVEAQLTADQIKQLFANIEQGATAAGGNRTMIGKGVDATSAVNKAWEDLKTKVQNSGPIKNVDAMYDQAAEKLKQATGGDQGVMKYVQKYRDFAKEHPIAQSLIYSALIAAAGISGAGLGGAAALGLFKLVDKLLQGEKFSSAAYSGAKTGAMAYGASKVGDLIKGTQGQAPDSSQIPSGNPSGDAQAAFGGDPNDAMTPWGTMSDEALQRISYQQAVREFINKYAQDPSNPSAQVVQMAKDFAKTKVYGKAMGESLSESTIKLLFSKISLEHSKCINEGIMDTIKGAAGKAVGAVKQFGTNLTTKVTADKLNSAWEKAGKPTDSTQIASLLSQNGVPEQVTKDVFAKMKISMAPAAAPNTKVEPKVPAPTTTAPAATGRVEPKVPAATQPAAPAASPTVNPELQKRLAARKAGKPVYSGGLEEGADRQAELEMALQKAKQITKQIKYDDTATDIIVQIQMLAEKFNIDKDSLESAIDDVYNAKNQLESAVYGLDEVFEEALQQSRWDDDEMLDENLRKWFKEKWVRFGPDGKIRGDCARGDDSEGKPKCLPQSKAHSLGKKGRASAAARKRREDPNPERSGKAINVNTKKKTDEEQLDELKCWPGYTRVQGVPAGAPGSCKKKTSEDQAPMFTPEMKCPHCNGEMVSEELMNEKKDACYYKVKSRYKVWPSAYASGALVKCRKKGASNWGTGGKKNEGIEEDTAYAGGMGQGGNAGQSYRKYKVKPSGIGQGISETEAVNRNDGDGWRWYDIKPAGR